MGEVWFQFLGGLTHDQGGGSANRIKVLSYPRSQGGLTPHRKYNFLSSWGLHNPNLLFNSTKMQYFFCHGLVVGLISFHWPIMNFAHAHMCTLNVVATNFVARVWFTFALSLNIQHSVKLKLSDSLRGSSVRIIDSVPSCQILGEPSSPAPQVMPMPVYCTLDNILSHSLPALNAPSGLSSHATRFVIILFFLATNPVSRTIENPQMRWKHKYCACEY